MVIAFFLLSFVATAASTDTIDGVNYVRGPDGNVAYSFPANQD